MKAYHDSAVAEIYSVGSEEDAAFQNTILRAATTKHEALALKSWRSTEGCAKSARGAGLQAVLDSFMSWQAKPEDWFQVNLMAWIKKCIQDGKASKPSKAQGKGKAAQAAPCAPLPAPPPVVAAAPRGAAKAKGAKKGKSKK